MRFLGRGNTIRRPLSMMEGRPLSNTVGHVLDPIFSLRVKLMIPAGLTAHVTFATMAASSRDAILLIADKYHDPISFERTSTHAWSHSQILLNYLGMQRGEAHLFQHLANRLLYSDTSMRPPAEFLKLSTLNVTTLWKFGISGDHPILLVRISASDDLGVVRQLLRAHEYWRMKLLTVDLVILNEKEASYIQDLQQSLEGMVNSSLAVGRAIPGSSGKIFILRADLIDEAECCLLLTAEQSFMQPIKNHQLT
jgi:cyclic beta-1,2-glucan synthetase